MSSEGLKRYWREVRAIAEEEGVSVARARKLWRDREDNTTRPDIDIAVNAILQRAENSDETHVCPYCRMGFFDGEATRTCPSCSTIFHEECSQEMRRCSTLGCGGNLRAREARQRVPVSVTPSEPITITVPSVPFRERVARVLVDILRWFFRLIERGVDLFDDSGLVPFLLPVLFGALVALFLKWWLTT